MSRGVGTPSRDFTSVVLCSSRMMSMHSSTHSSQMNTVGPAISLRTSCWLLPQNEQYSVFLESPPLDLVIVTPLSRPRTPCGWDYGPNPNMLAAGSRLHNAKNLPNPPHLGGLSRLDHRLRWCIKRAR